jgi:hypothetical protein
MRTYSECQNCGSTWHPGTEEHDWQACSACGWRAGDPVVDEDDDGAEDDDLNYDDQISDFFDADHNPWDDDDQDDDPTDSRNI